MGWWTDLKRKTKKIGQSVGLVYTPVSSPYDDSGLTPFQRQRLQERQEQQQAIEGRLERSEAAQQVAEGVDEQRSGLMGLGAQARGLFSGATRQQFGSAAEQAQRWGVKWRRGAAALQGLDQDISAYEDLGEQQEHLLD